MLEWEGAGKQQFSSRTWASSTETRIKWLVPKSSPSQKNCTSAHMQLWLLASFTFPGFSFPMQAPNASPHLGRKADWINLWGGLVAAKLPRISRWVLKPFCSKLRKEPLKPHQPQVEATLHCHTKLNFLFILQSNLSLHNMILRFNLIMILHITL